MYSLHANMCAVPGDWLYDFPPQAEKPEEENSVYLNHVSPLPDISRSWIPSNLSTFDWS